MIPKILPGEHPLDEISAAQFGLERISLLSDTICLFVCLFVCFFHLDIFYGVGFQYPQVLLSECFEAFMIWQFDSLSYRSLLLQS